MRKSFKAFVSAIFFALFLHSHALAITYCAKPHGVATRQIAREDLADLVTLLENRLGKDKNFLLVAHVPEAIQKESRFDKFGLDELLRQRMDDPKIIEAAAEYAKARKLNFSQREATEHYLREIHSIKTGNDDVGLVYLYSNRTSTINRFSEEIATKDGLVVEGKSQDVKGLLSATDIESPYFNWWGKNLLKEIDVLVSVGFSPNPEIRRFMKKDAILLKVADWKTATTKGVPKLMNFFDVKPADAAVLNLFPVNDVDVRPWGMDAKVSSLYVANGKRLQFDHEKLGYAVHRAKNGDDKTTVINWIKDQALTGKKVLVIAETTKDSNGEYFMRIPGLDTGISAADLLSLDDHTISQLFIVTCNAQALSGKLPISTIGTIYTDVAARLIRSTFAAQQVDRLQDYLQVGFDAAFSWIGPVARLAEKLGGTSTENPNVFSDGVLQFKEAAQIWRVERPPVPAASVLTSTQSVPSSENSSTPSDPDRPLMLFGVGVFGAVCREGLRWKRLMELKRGRSFLKVPYIVLSLVLTLAAGGVAYLFSTQIGSHAVGLVVAFVAGAGFEKLVQMAADLKIWNPLNSVSMGSDTHAASEAEAESSIGTLSFLRHGR